MERSSAFGQLAALAFVGLLGVAGVWTVWRSVTVDRWPSLSHPAPQLSEVDEAAPTAAAVRRLEREGVVVSAPVRRALNLLLGAWSRRSDLRSKFSDNDGSPDIAGLLGWAETLPDSESTAYVPHLGDFDELRGRLGIVGSDNSIRPVMYWSLQNRRRPSQNLTAAVGRLTDYWIQRPELHARFIEGGRVDVLGFVEFVNRLPRTDPGWKMFVDDSVPLHQAAAEMRRNRG